MSRKRRRMTVVFAGLALLGIAVALVLTAFEDNLVFFFSPSDVMAQEIDPERRIRIGGLVEDGSVVTSADGLDTKFRVTDGAAVLSVTYKGQLPDLFREGQGVVAEGNYRSGVFEASEVLAKHDETYMPPEVAEALKKSGRWKEGETK
jgi:cytochrome c-type biogenesis protein CcmE